MNAETFNSLYPVGTRVFAYPGFRPQDDPAARRLVTRTRSEAQKSASGHDVIWVDGEGSYISLTHVDVVSEAEWEAAKLADTVASEGALPVPAGSVRLTAEREAEVRDRLAEARNLAAEADWPLKEYQAIRQQQTDTVALLFELGAVRAERDQDRCQLDARNEHLAFLERSTLPELRRTIEHHKDGKQRWRERAERAETERDALQKRLHEAALTKVWVNEDGKRFVFLEDIAPVLLGVEPNPEATP